MALGSSAPEILLNVIEIVCGQPAFYAGALGPSTIVGSAAFNLLVITAVCVACITEGSRKIKDMKVYGLTAVTSVLAYVWLLIILIVSSPDVITPWEGIVTFMMFWVLLIVAYAASKNFFRAEVAVAPEGSSAAKPSQERRMSIGAGAADGGNTVKNALRLADKMPGLKGSDEEKVQTILDSLKPVSVATHTRNSMAWLTGKKPRPIFDEATNTIQTGQMGGGTLAIDSAAQAAKQKEANGAGGGGKDVVKDMDGSKMAVLCFKEEAVEVMEDCGTATVVVERRGAMDKTVTVNFSTADISATAGKDYTAVDGELSFAPGVKEMQISIPILDDDRFEKSETFRVKLADPSSNAELDEKGALAMVKVCNDDELQQKTLSLIERMNRDKWEVAMEQWKGQFSDAAKPGTETDEAATPAQWAIHILTVPFKVTFALVPPVQLGGGWPAFCTALGFIALMTVLVGDLAGNFGCVVGLKPAITAITFVALGTSMPDTFASMAAAKAEPTADNSVGNVTGSNCVNVFLGLGLPWTIGAIYWAAASESAKAEWLIEATKRYATNPNIQPYLAKGEPVFVVEAGDLGLSVVVFTVCALICLGGLSVRRKLFGGELGGPSGPRSATAGFYCCLWVVYVVVSSMQTEGIIDVTL